MRPTAMQVFCNIDLFEKLLEEAGVDGAHAKLISLTRAISEWRTLDGWVDLYGREVRGSQQSPYRFPNKRDPARDRIRMAKRVGVEIKHFMHYKQEAAARMDKIVRKINQWPDLQYDEAALSKTFDRHDVKRRLRRRASRRRNLNRFKQPK